MSIKNKIPELIEYVNFHKNYLLHQKKIFDILEGDLLTEVLTRLREMLISDRAFGSAKQQVAPINLLRRIIEKLSKVYALPPERKATPESNQGLVDYYVDQFELNTHLAEVNRFFNASKYASFEPYMSNRRDEANLRVVLPHQHLVYSDDMEDPTYPTIFIKIMGTKQKETMDARYKNKSKVKEVEYYFAYSEDEFIAFDSDGEVLQDFTNEVDGINPFGVIPQTYVNRSRHLLMPVIDSDTLQMSTLIPILLTNLNFAVHFLSYSIIYGIDVDAENLEINPNAFWLLKSDENGQSPQIGTIKPDVDVDKVLNLIHETVASWLETRNIRVSSGGRLSADNAVSGVSLMIKEMDTTVDRREQTRFFIEAEKEFWNKMKSIHNYWVDSGSVSGMPKFTEDFEIDITFPEPKPIEDQTEIINRASTLLRERLITKKKALMMVFPELSETAIDEMLLELEEEDSIELTIPEAPVMPEEDEDNAEERMPDEED